LIAYISEKFGEEKRYEIRLTASLDMMRVLLPSTKVEIVKDAYEKGSKNCQMLSHFIQKDLTKACAKEVTAVIKDEIRGRKFSVLIDESRDISIKEQMAMILRSILHIISKIILTHKQICGEISWTSTCSDMTDIFLQDMRENGWEPLIKKCQIWIKKLMLEGHLDEESKRLAEIYAEDFDIGDLTILTPEFLGCTELGKIAEIMVKASMHTSYKLHIQNSRSMLNFFATQILHYNIKQLQLLEILDRLGHGILEGDSEYHDMVRTQHHQVKFPYNHVNGVHWTFSKYLLLIHV
ncbi:hypothetical protein ACJX0J_037013, partial [Zea mays]